MKLQKNTISIQLTHVSKKYEIHHDKPTLVEKFIKGRNETFWALRDINLTIDKGERVGIIGKNGSGKTTFLKIIAGITTPTNGVVQTSGRIVSLIDLGAGFHPDLPGYQNIYLNGMLLGLRKQEIEQKIKDIVAFADLKQFIDAPLFTYSSGMALRLGFSIAVHANPEVLLLDENLSIGDSDFQKKTQHKLHSFFQKGITVIVVTHRLNFIAKNCTRVLQLQKGHLVHDGGLELLDQYEPQWKQNR
jgi:ABC-type polysaccharide/polyol phosphate transport system ATPase subunit